MSKADLSRALGKETISTVVVRLTDEEHWAWREWCVYHRVSSTKAMRDALLGLMKTQPVPPRVGSPAANPSQSPA
jgi:hypothetical protein